MASQRTAFKQAISTALAQSTDDRELLPLVRFILASYDAKRSARKPKASATKKAVEANAAAVRG